MSKVIMDVGHDGLMYLVAHLYRASSRSMWKVCVLKKWKLQMERLWKVKTPADLGTTGGYR